MAQPPRRGRQFITIAAAARILDSTPADVETLTEQGDLDSTTERGRLMVSKVSVNAHKLRTRATA